MNNTRLYLFLTLVLCLHVPWNHLDQKQCCMFSLEVILFGNGFRVSRTPPPGPKRIYSQVQPVAVESVGSVESVATRSKRNRGFNSHGRMHYPTAPFLSAYVVSG